MKKAITLLTMTAFAVMCLSSCGNEKPYEDSYENYLSAVDATKDAKNMTIHLVSSRYEDFEAIVYYDWYEMDEEILTKTTYKYLGYLFTDDGCYYYRGTSMESISFGYFEYSPKDVAAEKIHEEIVSDSLKYDIVSSKDFYDSLTYTSDGLYVINGNSEYSAGSLRISSGHLTTMSLTDSVGTETYDWSNFGTTKTKNVSVA